MTVTVEVENTGATYSGKEVVQIYASLPQDGSRKEFRRLVGYEKTEELKPGEKEMLNIVLPAKAFASFLEEQQEWRIQAGAYGIWIGNSLSEAKLSAGVKVSADVMMEKTKKLEDHSEVVEIKDCAEELCRRAEEWTALLEELPNVSFEPESEEKKEMLIINGNAFYEIDLECVKKKKQCAQTVHPEKKTDRINSRNMKDKDNIRQHE